MFVTDRSRSDERTRKPGNKLVCWATLTGLRLDASKPAHRVQAERSAVEEQLTLEPTLTVLDERGSQSGTLTRKRGIYRQLAVASQIPCSGNLFPVECRKIPCSPGWVIFRLSLPRKRFAHFWSVLLGQKG